MEGTPGNRSGSWRGTESPVAVGLEMLFDFSADRDCETGIEGHVFDALRYQMNSEIAGMSVAVKD